MLDRRRGVAALVGDVIDPERLLADAEAAVERAKQHGRNRVERVDGYSGVLRAANPQAPEASAKHGRLSDQPAPKP